MTEQQSLREKLFPDGMPEPEDFIRVLAAYILGNRPENPDSSRASCQEE